MHSATSLKRLIRYLDAAHRRHDGNPAGTATCPAQFGWNCHPEADMGIPVHDAGGHMPMCGHSTIGCVNRHVESGRAPSYRGATGEHC